MNLLHEEKYVVIDIETTGNRIKSGDEIIQIGLCTIQGGEIIETFSSYVKPSIEIPPFIQKLTGITEVDVQDSPVIKELLPVIQEKMEGSILVAHNIHFDLGVLQHYLTEHDYPPFKGMIIDTVELSRILYPNRSGYRLSELAVDFQIQHETPHQADSDALATAKLFLLLCSRMRKLPLLTIQRMIPLAQSLYSDIELLFRKIEHEKCLRPVIQTEEEMEEFRHLVLRRKEEELNTSIENHFIEQIPIEEIKPSVILGSKIENYEYREAQDQLSEEILKAFQAEEHALFEAGTGTGKTLAYLLASIYWAKRTKSKVVISTHTIQLQEQIRDKEIPKLQEILPFTFEDALIKGRTHYLCLRKFEQSLYQTNEKNYDYELTKLQLLVWLTETETGDVEELNLPSGGKDYWLKIQSETDSCLHHKCPWFERCFYFRSRKKTQQADLIITNHSLLLADFEGQKLLPHYDYVILDEAHHVEQIASGQFGQNMTYTRLHFVLQRLYSEDKPTLTQRFLELLELSEEGFRVMPTVNEIQEQLQEMKSGIDQLFTHLYILAEKKQGNDRTDSRRAVRLIHPLEDEEEWYLVLQLTDQLRSRKDQLNHAYHTLVQWYDSLQAEWLHDLRSTYTDWSSAIRTLAEYIDQLEALILHYDRNHVYWIEYEPKGARNSSGVFQQPLEVTTFLQPLFQEKKSAILTSATLQVNRSFQYFIDQLGMPLERLRVQAFASPFDYSQQSSC
ncbi:exonuclease domain-containing protein [Caldalkalibacillus mannanilyticus]|uniref:exonuclease domain-containing protein n=1 Tax=Caldalkalibacillus mannanilyticus TaxID=1418 RepID=UPI000686523A|nr:exonuclease domain-containing protein [Caldalkalibacillus mannanilyticus]